jgi:hypothetical protein
MEHKMFLPHLQAKPKPQTEPETKPVPAIADNWRKVPGRKISDYPSPQYEFFLSDNSRRSVFVERWEGMKEAREALRSILEPGTEPETSAAVECMPATEPERKRGALFLQFKAKTETEPETGRKFVRVPTFNRNHCSDLQAFRTSRRFGGYANSDLFPAILQRAVTSAGIGSRLFLENLPPAVVVLQLSFLSVIQIGFQDT